MNFYEAIDAVRNGSRVRTEKMDKDAFVYSDNGIFMFFNGGEKELFSIHDFYFEDEWNYVFDNNKYSVIVGFEASFGEEDLYDAFGTTDIQKIKRDMPDKLDEFLYSYAEQLQDDVDPAITVLNAITGSEEYSI